MHSSHGYMSKELQTIVDQVSCSRAGIHTQAIYLKYWKKLVILGLTDSP